MTDLVVCDDCDRAGLPERVENTECPHAGAVIPAPSD